jgi:hypothetical protein
LSTTPATDRLPGLLAHHVTRLRASGLTDDTIAETGIYSVTKLAALASLLGRKISSVKKLAPAIVIPFKTMDGRNGYCRVRPDTPRQVKDKPVKYESPTGQPNQPYFPPSAMDEIRRPTAGLLLTEGEFKALALTQEGFPCIGVVGVFGWKQKNFASLLPELELIDWNGRTVWIVFDSDIGSNPDVLLAESRLAKAMADRGSKVLCVRLPDGTPDADGHPTKMGADDYLVAHGREAFRQLLVEAVEPEPLEAQEFLRPAADIEPAGVAKSFLSEHESDELFHLRYWRGSFYLWLEGRYVEMQPGDVRAELIRSINLRYIFLTTSIVGNLMDQVKVQAALSSRIETPSWLTNPPADWPAHEMLATRRELVHLPTLAAGTACHIPATPRYFTENVLDFEFAPDAPPPQPQDEEAAEE